MSKRKYIERRTILQAIRFEPLKAGRWVEGGYSDDMNTWVPLDDPNCSVCAVGACLRRAGLNNQQIDDFGDRMIEYGSVSYDDNDDLTLRHRIEEALESKEYLHALSVKFESQAEKTGSGQRTRKILRQFVLDNFPTRILLSARR